jgi:hypothetical protein
MTNARQLMGDWLRHIICLLPKRRTATGPRSQRVGTDNVAANPMAFVVAMRGEPGRFAALGPKIPACSGPTIREDLPQ